MSALRTVELAPEFASRVLHDVSMAKHTSWHAGGAADFFFTPRDIMDLASFIRQLPPEVPLLWVGLGSNLLVRDGGIRGAVVSTHGALGALERHSVTRIRAEAGVACARIARQCVKWGLGPAEFFAGIPGTLGGALAMNAGAFGQETWSAVASVDTIDRLGKIHVRARADYQVSYRHVVPPQACEWFVSATLTFEERAGAPEDELQQLLERRRATQPIGEWSCGSVFTNPKGDHAARLIEAAGLKGHRIGDASVSTKHANFIINHGAASARDLESLIEHVRDTVARVHGITLTPEVRIVGQP